MEDRSNIPSNQIWYTTLNHKTITLSTTDYFDVKLISNTYSNGIGILQFDGSLETIGAYAFCNCEQLRTIILPSTIKVINKSAFFKCTSLETFIAPKNLDTIDEHAFDLCIQLNNIELNNVSIIGAYAFRGCYKNLQSINIPQSVTNIKDGAFYGCCAVTNVHIPHTVHEICPFAFTECTGNLFIDCDIPDAKPSIKDDTGHDVWDVGPLYKSKFHTIILGNNVSYIGSHAFHNCKQLSTFQFSSNVTTIASYAFNGCINLKKLIIPSSVTTIKRGAFSDCGYLDLIIPNSVKNIENNLFCRTRGILTIDCETIVQECGKGCLFKKIILGNNVKYISNRAFDGCKDVQEIVLGENIVSIGISAFAFTSISYLVIPKSIKKIQRDAFGGCVQLQQVICHGLTPPEITDTTFATYTKDIYGYSDVELLNIKVYVPYLSLQEYQEQEWWLFDPKPML